MTIKLCIPKGNVIYRTFIRSQLSGIIKFTSALANFTLQISGIKLSALIALLASIILSLTETGNLKMDKIDLFFIITRRHAGNFFKYFGKIKYIFEAGLNRNFSISHLGGNHEVLSPFNFLFMNVF
jgi:hypothetical protein